MAFLDKNADITFSLGKMMTGAFLLNIWDSSKWKRGTSSNISNKDPFPSFSPSVLFAWRVLRGGGRGGGGHCRSLFPQQNIDNIAMILPLYFHFGKVTWYCNNIAIILPFYFHHIDMILPWYCHDIDMILPWYCHYFTTILPYCNI